MLQQSLFHLAETLSNYTASLSLFSSLVLTLYLPGTKKKDVDELLNKGKQQLKV